MSDTTTTKILLNAMVARVQRITQANGYITNAGANVFGERVAFSPEGDGDLVIGVIVTNEEFVPIGVNPRYLDTVTHFEIGGFIRIAGDDRITPIDLLADIKAAVFESSGDVLDLELDRLEAESAAIVPADGGMDYTVVILKVLARWCDHSMEQ